MNPLLKLCIQLSEMAESSGLNGLDFQHYSLCRRRCWLHANRCQFSDDENIKTGKLLHSNSYVRDSSVSGLMGIAPDRIDWTLCEIQETKKSNSHLFAAESQLIFYLSLLSAATNRLWSGYIVTYPGKRKHWVELNNQNLNAALIMHEEILSLKTKSSIPQASRVAVCDGCSNRIFCWKED